MCEISNNFENGTNPHRVLGMRNIRHIFIVNHDVPQR